MLTPVVRFIILAVKFFSINPRTNRVKDLRMSQLTNGIYLTRGIYCMFAYQGVRKVTFSESVGCALNVKPLYLS